MSNYRKVKIKQGNIIIKKQIDEMLWKTMIIIHKFIHHANQIT